MSKQKTLALAWGIAAGLFLLFGLEPTGWLFYHASFSTGVDWLYWGYSAFRGAGHFFALWPYQLPTILIVALVITALRWPWAWRTN